VFAREEGAPLEHATVDVSGEIDPQRRVREDVTVFTSVRLAFTLAGVDREQAERLVERFKGR
jgi:hypothetical protein